MNYCDMENALFDKTVNKNFIIQFFPNDPALKRDDLPNTLLSGRTLRLTIGEELAKRTVDRVWAKGEQITVVKFRKQGKLIFKCK